VKQKAQVVVAVWSVYVKWFAVSKMPNSLFSVDI